MGRRPCPYHCMGLAGGDANLPATRAAGSFELRSTFSGKPKGHASYKAFRRAKNTDPVWNPMSTLDMVLLSIILTVAPMKSNAGQRAILLISLRMSQGKRDMPVQCQQCDHETVYKGALFVLFCFIETGSRYMSYRGGLTFCWLSSVIQDPVEHHPWQARCRALSSQVKPVWHVLLADVSVEQR